MLRSKVQIPKYLIIYHHKALVLSIGHFWLPSSLANDGSGSRCRTVLWDCFLTQLLKKPRINSEKPINKAITSPQNSLTVKFIRHNIGPVLTSEWPVIDNNISSFLRRSLIPSETVWLIVKQLYCTFLSSLLSLRKHKWRSLTCALLQINEIFRNTFLIAYHCWSYLTVIS